MEGGLNEELIVICRKAKRISPPVLGSIGVGTARNGLAPVSAETAYGRMT